MSTQRRTNGLARGAACFAAAMGLTTCSRSPESPAVAVVAGEPISEALFAQFAKKKTGVKLEEISPERRTALLIELEQLKAASLVGARSAGPDIEQELELSRIELLTQRAAIAAGVYRTPTEAELRVAYESFAFTLPRSEYHARHVLVASEEAAKLLIVKLRHGADFAALARQESADDSRQRGGDLGWVSLDSLPAAMGEAIKLLQPGAFSTEPVHTIYGWHVILLVDTRAAQLPALEEVRPQLIANLQQERYQRFLQESLHRASGS